MIPPDPTKPVRETHDSPWALAARRTAAVAGGFSFLLAVLLVIEAFRIRPWNPLIAPEIQQLKAELVRHPRDEAIRKRIREADAVLLRHHQASIKLADRGKLLLVASCLLGLFAAEYARREHLRQTRRQAPPRETVADEIRLAGQSRRAVLVMGVVLAGGLAAFISPARQDALLEYARSTGATGPAAGAGEAVASPADMARNWPMFRGVGGLGVAAEATPPTQWDGSKGVNIRWKTAVPLPGHNSPIVWNDRVFLSGADEKQREVYCFAADTGKLMWRQSVRGLPGASAPQISDDTGFAPSTMATDGHRVYAIFPTGDLASFDLEGNPGWSLNFGLPDNSYGHASSLSLYRNLLIVQLDQGSSDTNDRSAVMAINGATGQTVWKAKRNVPNSWSTPILTETDAGAVLITSANPWVIAYHPEDGAELWRASCLDGEVAPSPTAACGMAYVANAGAKLSAIRLGGKGDVTRTHVVWTAEDGLPDIVSPMSNGRFVFLVTSDGLVTCYDAATGKKQWEHPLGNASKASPILAGNQVYLVDTRGVTHIFEAAATFKEIAAPPLGEEVYATPAFVGKRIYLRGKQSLFCVEEK